METKSVQLCGTLKKMVENNEISFGLAQDYQRRANRIARSEGYFRATEIKFYNNEIETDRVIDHTSNGYRKFTTDEYVPNAYLRNFGWKNTYYQNAECTVRIHI